MDSRSRGNDKGGVKYKKMKNKINKKIVVIVGTTASGKTKLAVRLAYKFNGEIVSADSRQVYRGLNIGTGKDLADFRLKIKNKIIDIPYHLIDITSPKRDFNLAEYQKLAYQAMADILKRGKLPIIAGGTGLYVQAVIDGLVLPVGKPDLKLRKTLEKYNTEKLFKKLQSLNKKFADALNNSDKNNKRRLIRYIEIAENSRKAKESKHKKRNSVPYHALVIGLTWPKEILHKRIYDRLITRLEKEDMVGEVAGLHKMGVSWKRLESFGLEYKFISRYLQKKISYDELVDKLFIAIKKFSKRQMTWWRRWERRGTAICWTNDKTEPIALVKKFLK